MPLKLLDVASGAPRLPKSGPEGPLTDAEKFWVLSSDLFAVYDQHGCFTKVNPAWERALGWTADQLMGQLVLDLIHPDDLREAVEAGDRAMRGSGRVERSESRYRCVDGTYRWFVWSAYIDGEQWCTVAKEISGRKAAEASSEALRLRNQEAYAAIEAATWEWDMRRHRLAPVPPGDTPDGPSRMPEMSPAHQAAVASAARQVAEGRDSEFLLRFPAAPSNGPSRWLESRGSAVLGAGGAVVGVRGTTQDVTEAAQAHIETRQSKDFAQATLDSLGAYVVVLNERGQILAVNAAWQQMTRGAATRNVGIGADYISVCDAIGVQDGYAATIARSLDEMLKGKLDAFVVEYPFHSPAGERWLTLGASRHIGAGPPKMVLQHHDITSRVRAEIELREARDYLSAVTESMGEALWTLDAHGALMYMNPAAELLLGWSKDELRGRLMHDAVHFRRPDGRPFPVAECPMTASRVAGDVVRVSDDVFIRRDGSQVDVQYTSSPLKTGDAITGSVVVFSDITARKAAEEDMRRQLDAFTQVRHIREALTEERMVLYAQPIWDLASGTTIQHELLIRMRARDGTLLPPDTFLPAAERHGLIAEIDRWVIGRAAQLSGQGHLVQLNLSAGSLADPQLFEYFRRELERYGAQPRNMVVEVTETALMKNEQLAAVLLERMSLLGCEIALDDFGVGYGSFSYLKHFPVNYLKIDREFIADIATNVASRHVVQAVVSLARGFGQKTIAEGIEDESTISLLREMGVDYAQGFAFGRPAPLDETLLVHQAAARSAA